MKYWKIILFVLPVLLGACGSTKNLENKDTKPTSIVKSLTAQQVMSQVGQNLLEDEFLTAKMNFRLQMNGQDLSVGGNLKMKKDEVIQLSFVALGLIEAARMEFTKEDVLFIDRMNKRYVKATYSQLDFLQKAGIDFDILQSLFRNAVFRPSNVSEPTVETASAGSQILNMTNKYLHFKFMISSTLPCLLQTQIVPVSPKADAVFDWKYSSFEPYKGIRFPMEQQISFKGQGQQIQLDLKLSRLGNNSTWEPRTKPSSSYKAMKPEEILKLLQF